MLVWKKALHSPLLISHAEGFVAITTQEAHIHPLSGGGGERQDIWQE